MIRGAGGRATSVLLVDGDVLVRKGLAAVIRGEYGLLMVAQAATAATSVSEASHHKPDVAVIDADLVVGRDIDLCERIRAVSPQTRCIIHAATAFVSDNARGEDAVVLKQLRGDGLADTIRNVTRHHA